MTEADKILKIVYEKLDILESNFLEKFLRIDDIIIELEKINNDKKINIKSTGTISERLCKLGLEAAVPNLYRNLNNDWKWIGDFYLKGAPFNIIVSVKSFTAKERLLASGTGNLLSPTIAFGLFNDPAEWSEQRVKSYLYRGFFAIYMPKKLFHILGDEVKNITNINNKPFLRPLINFTDDLKNAVQNEKIDPKKI